MGIEHTELDVVGPSVYLTPVQEAAIKVKSPVDIHDVDLIGPAEQIYKELATNTDEVKRRELKHKLDIINEIGVALAPYLVDLTLIGLDKNTEFKLD